ncbi:MAG: Hsp20/alpha crystallin family protein [Hyphomicrobiaceae bacterium]
MVERSHTAGWLPSVTGAVKAAGERIAGWFAPRSDASVSAETYQISLELPGCRVEDIDISIHDGAMIVSGEKRFEQSEQGESYFFSEREYGAFQRSFRLPADARADAIVADFKDGLLKITIPKVTAATREQRKIAIRSE